MKMSLTLTIFAGIAIALAIRGVRHGQQRLRHTTLRAAGRWALGGTVLWAATLMLSAGGFVSPPVQDALWYASALLALCPAISVLGARRPGAGVWTLFVVLPLLAVLGWPLLTIFSGADSIRLLRLETPQLIGFMLVLLMGAGNYLGTRFSLPAALLIVSLCLVVGSVSAVAPAAVRGSLLARQLATIGLGLCVLLGERISFGTRRDGAGESVAESRVERTAPFDRLWSDYRDTFGIVWARRFQERMNGIAVQQHWPVRLGDRGFEWMEEQAADRELITDRIDQTFRWLLRRFVDPPWIDERISPSS